MIIETKVYTCRKCQSEDLVKNGTNTSSISLDRYKACGAYGVLERKERATEDKEGTHYKSLSRKVQYAWD